MPSRSLRCLPIIVLAGLGSLTAVADEPPATAAGVASTAAEVSIPFAGTSIQDWKVVDNQTVLIQTNGNRWYKARLMSPCTDLPFMERVGFESNPDGSFDKFSVIHARGQTCQVVSLTKSAPPPKKDAKKRDAPLNPPQ